jgi:hypothetical protein
MLVSTKLGTVVQFLSRGELSSAEGLAPAQAPYSAFACLAVAALPFNYTRKFTAQERRHRESPFGGEHSRFAKRFLIQGERDISRSGHVEYV